MNVKQRLSDRERDMKRMLELFSRHGTRLTHQQCHDVGITDIYAVSAQLLEWGYLVNCSVKQTLHFAGDETQSMFESNYELVESECNAGKSKLHIARPV